MLPSAMFSRALSTLRASLRLHKTSQLQPSALIHARNMSLVTEKRNILDHKLRLFAAKYKVRRRLYGALSSDPELPPNIRDKHRYNLSKLPRNSSFTRVTNRCIFSGRSRAVHLKVRMYCALANQGQLNGVKKASW